MNRAAQLKLGFPAELRPSAYDYGTRSSGETHGVVLTKPHIVDLILDLASYTPGRDLATLALLEPACGEGVFVAAAASRLVRSARLHCRQASDLLGAITAYDIDPEHVALSRCATVKALRLGGISAADAEHLATCWIKSADFLLASQGHPFDAVVGNPPYIRVEQLAAELQSEYRTRYETLYDRADLYVAFIERALSLLSPDGILSFICADRWIRNKYGAPLRELISQHFSLRCYIDLHQASPFETKVSAYPSIFAIGPGQHTRRIPVLTLSTASPEECVNALAVLQGKAKPAPGVSLTNQNASSFSGAPWVLGKATHLLALENLENHFAPLEALSGTRVGIGVATGNDKVYIVGEDAAIEANRLVPLVMRADITNGAIVNAHRYVINTFCDEGGLIDLRDYPLLAAYLETHETAIRRRHVSQKNTVGWFRTIDRVYPDLVRRPKLLIPDIAGANEVAFDSGHFHPHHNLYYVTSKEWEMEVLGALLSSRVALFFVWSYAVKMRGGYLRFQAQYLRRIRVPEPSQIPPRLALQLKQAYRERDFPSLDQLSLQAYGLSDLPEFDFVDTRNLRRRRLGGESSGK